MIKIPKKTTKKKATSTKKKIVKKPATALKQTSAVNKKMAICEVIQKNPEAAEVMLKYGLHCIGCHIAFWETVEEGAMAHGLSGKQIDKMVDDMNKLASKKKK